MNKAGSVSLMRLRSRSTLIKRRLDKCLHQICESGDFFRSKRNYATATQQVRGYFSLLEICERQKLPISRYTSSLTADRAVISKNLICTNTRSKSTAAYSDTVSEETNIFPSLVIGANGKILPQGSFAEAQAEFLDPDLEMVSSLSKKLSAGKIGVVAHYYMDVELQGVLDAIKSHQQQQNKQPYISIADSLAMGDNAVQMARAGATSIICLGVDFMAESVSAILARNGFGHVPVYRSTSKAIGCSLAESAETTSYKAWLTKAANSSHKALHVVYINTSLGTKALSASIVPTITCTSSNVLKTILQASSQLGPDKLQIYYGPDTYMGRNLVTMLSAILDGGWSDERIQRELHKDHNRQTLAVLKSNIEVFPEGNCIVHHMFGKEVVDTVKQYYSDAFVTAHLEVPGEMFQIAMEKSLEGKGVVGSTSDILAFISKKVAEAAKEEIPKNSKFSETAEISNNLTNTTKRLKFILGTEAGMVTSIVRSVQNILAQVGSQKLETEIVFPVASEAMTVVDDGDPDLSIVPGVNATEGCSTAGGCATCPFMKMNDLDTLSDIVDMIIDGGEPNELKLQGHLPPVRLKDSINGISTTELGVQPIMYMRDFMKNGVLSDELVRKIDAGAI